MPKRYCKRCNGNGITEDGYGCWDCQGTGCDIFPFCDCELDCELEEVAPDAQPSSPGPTHTEQESE